MQGVYEARKDTIPPGHPLLLVETIRGISHLVHIRLLYLLIRNLLIQRTYAVSCSRVSFLDLALKYLMRHKANMEVRSYLSFFQKMPLCPNPSDGTLS